MAWPLQGCQGFRVRKREIVTSLSHIRKMSSPYKVGWIIKIFMGTKFYIDFLLGKIDPYK